MFMYTAEDDYKTEIRLSLLETNVVRQEKPPEPRSHRHSSVGNPPAAVASVNRDHKDYSIQIVPVSFKTEPTQYPLKATVEEDGDNFKSLHSRVPKKNYNVTQLFKAIYDGRVDDVRFSFQYANIRHARDEQGCTPVIAAMLSKGSRSKRLELLDLLIKEGLNLRSQDEHLHRTAFGWGCYLGRVEELQKLADALEGDLDYQEKDSEGNTYLMLAILSKNIDTVRFVVDNMEQLSLSMDAVNHMGITPYILARKMGLRDIAELLNQKKNISKQKSDDSTFRTPREWSILGQVERTVQEELEMQQRPKLQRRAAPWRLSRRTPGRHYLPKLSVAQEEPELHEDIYLEEIQGTTIDGSPNVLQRSKQPPLNLPEPTKHVKGKRKQLTDAPSKGWLHDALVLWSGQHNAAYCHPAIMTRRTPSAKDNGTKGMGNPSKNKNARPSKTKRQIVSHLPISS